jgi:hypothetical protein
VTKVITMTVHKRPDYTMMVLQALKRCAGIADYLFLPSIDYSDRQDYMKSIFDKWTACKIEPIYHNETKGCYNNTHFVLKEGFKQSDFVIHIEDDTVPSKDFLSLMEFMDDKCRLNRKVQSLTGYNRQCKTVKEEFTPEECNQVIVHEYFTCWGIGFWKDRWEEQINPVLEAEKIEGYSNKSWAVEVLRKAHVNLLQAKPYLSRIQNIGARNGLHVPSAEWHEKNHRVQVWGGDFPDLEADFSAGGLDKLG